MDSERKFLMTEPSVGVRKQRNTNVEALRLVAMALIVFHHMFNYHAGSSGITDEGLKYIVDTFVLLIGRVGASVFFVITIWFLCSSRDRSFRSAVRRVWLLERELIFYSVGLFLLASCVFDLQDFSIKQLIYQFFPVLTGEWWFVSSYVLLILVAPFFIRGLEALTRRAHLTLLIILVATLSVLHWIPTLGSGLPGAGDFGALVFYLVLVSYLRWYVDTDALRAHRVLLVLLLMADVVLVAVFRTVGMMEIPFVSSVVNGLRSGLSFWTELTSILIVGASVPLFLLVVSMKERHNRLIAFLAPSSLSIYLISEFAPIRALLWNSLFTFEYVNHGPALWTCVLAVFAVMAGCVGIDLGRRVLFRGTFDRRPGHLFEVVWSRAARLMAGEK